MKYKIALIFVLFFSGTTLFAQKVKRIPPEKPKLIIGIVVDQMRYDYLYKYWDKYEKGGFKRLVNEGTLCKNTNYNYIFTQTGVGHATIFTGAKPANHGIVSNEWFVRSGNKTQYCVADKKEKTVGSKSSNGNMSPRLMLTSTIGDELKLSNNGKSKVIGISIKDRASILPAGHMANSAYWFDDATGNWITSTYYTDTMPQWVSDFNNKNFADLYLEKTWETIIPIEQYTESISDDNPYEVGINGVKTFPYNLAELSSKKGKFGKKKNYSLLRSVPYGNSYTKDFAIATILNEDLGKDKYTDFLSVSFSPTDYIGHKYGPTSVEIEDTYLRLDKELAHFLEFVDKNIGKENVLIFLTADHGVAYNSDFLKDRGVPAGKFKHNYAVALLKSYLNALYGEGDWFSHYGGGQIYLNHSLIEDSKLSLEDVQTKVSQFIIQFSGVANAMGGVTLQKSNFNDGIYMMMQNNFNPNRSGDILISLEPGWMDDTYSSTTHNSGYSYDTHVPLIWYGWKIKRTTVNRKLNIVNIAPTISTLLNISLPNGCLDGPILEILE